MSLVGERGGIGLSLLLLLSSSKSQNSEIIELCVPSQDTRGYQRLPEVTRGYQRLPGVTGGYQRLPEVTRSFFFDLRFQYNIHLTGAGQIDHSMHALVNDYDRWHALSNYLIACFKRRDDFMLRGLQLPSLTS